VGPLQQTLLGGGAPAVDPTAWCRRTELDATSWVDVAPGWLRGADTLLDVLVESVPWRQGKRWMYERMVDDPRVSAWYRAGDDLPHPALAAIRDALGEQYGKRFGAVGCNFYRDGNDSVAWHRDRELRELDDTIVAIVTLGGPRSFLVRPRGGGRSRDFRPGSGDLLVMGGRCQADWEHSVPKARCAPPRLSLSLRWAPRSSPPAAGRPAERSATKRR
jgi:alkylated DNA repair dioxygenase AlkB